jgi:hypothetical protein
MPGLTGVRRRTGHRGRRPNDGTHTEVLAVEEALGETHVEAVRQAFR